MSTATLIPAVSCHSRVICTNKACPDGPVNDGDGAALAELHNERHHRGEPLAHAEPVTLTA